MLRDVLISKRGLTGLQPLGKSKVSSQEFAAGVASTKAARVRASGPNTPNPTHRSINVVLSLASDGPRSAGQTHRGSGRI